MRRMIMLALLPLGACSLGDHGGVAATGSGGSREFVVADFTSVTLKGSDDVEISLGDRFSVHAEGPSAVLDKLRIAKEGSSLAIGRKSDADFNWGGHENARIFVTMPRIVAATITGSGDMIVHRAEADQFQASATGSGSIRIDDLKTQTATFAVTGSGDVIAKGSAQKVALSVTGSGDIDAGGLAAQQANASIAGSGNIRADVAGPATVSILGSGDADMGSGAMCTTSKLGSGTVTCGK